MYYFTQATINNKKRELKSLYPALKFKVIKDGAMSIIVEVKNATQAELTAIHSNINQLVNSPMLHMPRHESQVIAR
jgi:hypothetical protein